MALITAVILDGFHKGHVVRMENMPSLRLPEPRNLTTDYCCDADSTVNNAVPEYREYVECFRAVDGDVVMYSEKGKSRDFMSWFNREVSSESPWNEYTTLYFGFHNEPVVRKQDGTQMTEYDRGYEKGVHAGKIQQAKEDMSR